jgi:SOS-response transcriptional repressor LexA
VALFAACRTGRARWRSSSCQKPRLALAAHLPNEASNHRSSKDHVAWPRRQRQPRLLPAGNTVDVPMMGRIAAGVPIAAIQDHSSNVPVPPDMLRSGEHFALEVQGDSMIEAGILDGDTVIIRKPTLPATARLWLHWSKTRKRP